MGKIKINWALGGIYSIIVCILIGIVYDGAKKMTGLRSIQNVDAQQIGDSHKQWVSSDAPKLLQWELFGKSHRTQKNREHGLQLIGIFMSDQPELQAAVIADKNKVVDIFVLGDKLPANFVLKKITPSSVVIEDSGYQETLYFTEESTTTTLPQGRFMGPKISPEQIQKIMRYAPYQGKVPQIEELQKEYLRHVKPKINQ